MPSFKEAHESEVWKRWFRYYEGDSEPTTPLTVFASLATETTVFDASEPRLFAVSMFSGRFLVILGGVAFYGM